MSLSVCRGEFCPNFAYLDIIAPKGDFVNRKMNFGNFTKKIWEKFKNYEKILANYLQNREKVI